MSFHAVNKARRLAAARPTDAFSEAFRSATLTAAQAMRELWPIETLERAIAQRNPRQLLADRRWRTIEHELSESLQAALSMQLGKAANAELKRIEAAPYVRPRRLRVVRPTGPQILKASEEEKEDEGDDGSGFEDEGGGANLELQGSFDLQNPYTLNFVQSESAMLVSGVTERAREQIRQAIERGFVEGIPVRTTAQSIKATLGLDDRLALAVQNQMEQMSAQGASDDVIANAAAKYADRLLDYRATVIARTETMTASNRGILDSWRQAHTEGLLADGMQKQWIHGAGSERTCEACDELGDSDPVGMFETFHSDVLDDDFEAPPAHAQCRCTVGLVAPDSPAAE